MIPGMPLTLGITVRRPPRLPTPSPGGEWTPLAATQRRGLSFGVPFDGRSRSAPLLPLVALLLVTAGVGVVLHGGGPMPVKYGFTTAEALAATGRHELLLIKGWRGGAWNCPPTGWPSPPTARRG